MIQVSHFENRQVVLCSSTTPTNLRRYPLFVAGLIPLWVVQAATTERLDRLQARYNNQLQIMHAADGGLVTHLPCPEAKSAEEVQEEEAEDMVRNILQTLGIRMEKAPISYARLCRFIDQPVVPVRKIA